MGARGSRLDAVASAASADETAESRTKEAGQPSARKILNELSSDAPSDTEIEEGKPEEEGAPSGIPAMAVPTSLHQASTGQYTATGDMPTYQIRTPTTTLPEREVMAASPGTSATTTATAGQRELRRREKREAAREYRRKEYVKCLENRVAVLENQNKTLIEEPKALKDLYCHKAE